MAPGAGKSSFQTDWRSFRLEELVPFRMEPGLVCTVRLQVLGDYEKLGPGAEVSPALLGPRVGR